MGGHRRIVVAAVAVGLLCAPAAAHAALDFKPCPGGRGVQCATIDVPIDRSGHVPGTFTLLVNRIPAAHPSGRPPIVALAGGPGENSTDLTREFAKVLAGALRGRDLITFAQRGTGTSRIDCPGLDSENPPADAVAACGAALGPKRNFFTTRESVDDLDAIRAALGVDKISLFGVSYGTLVELGYAIRHGEHVERIVFDSTFSPGEDADPFSTLSFKEAPGVARTLCARGACHGITHDAYGDVLKLLGRLQKRPLAGTFVDPSGHKRKTTITALGLAALLPSIDQSAHLRAELPRADYAALHGDAAPLARLVAGGPKSAPPPTTENTTLYAVTRCEEEVWPFDRPASPAVRTTQARQALAAIPASVFSPFGPDIAYLTSLVPSCVSWPMAPAQPTFGPGAPAHVPVLLVHGVFDLRTPRAATDEVARMFPQSQTLLVPHRGHSATLNDFSGCAPREVSAFLDHGGKVRRCPDFRDPFAPRAIAPRSLHAVRGGVVPAVVMTVRDAFDELDAGSGVHSRLEALVRGGGLRGGTFAGHRHAITLRGYEFVGGLRVTGTVKPGGKATLKLAGAARGSLTFGPGKRVSGTVGGKPVHASAALQRRSIAAQVGR